MTFVLGDRVLFVFCFFVSWASIAQYLTSVIIVSVSKCFRSVLRVAFQDLCYVGLSEGKWGAMN